MEIHFVNIISILKFGFRKLATLSTMEEEGTGSGVYAASTQPLIG